MVEKLPYTEQKEAVPSHCCNQKKNSDSKVTFAALREGVAVTPGADLCRASASTWLFQRDSSKYSFTVSLLNVPITSHGYTYPKGIKRHWWSCQQREGASAPREAWKRAGSCCLSPGKRLRERARTDGAKLLHSLPPTLLSKQPVALSTDF